MTNGLLAAKKTPMKNPTLLNLTTALCTLLAGLGPARAQEAEIRLNALFKDYLDEHFRQ